MAGWNGSQNAGQPANGRGERPARPSQKNTTYHSSTSTSNFDSKRAALIAVALAALAAALYFVLSDDAPQKNAPHHSTTTTTNFNYKHSAPATYKPLDDISRVKPRKEYAEKAKTVDEALERFEEAQQPLLIEPLPKVERKGLARNMLFHSGTEQVLSWLCHIDLGEPPIPPPPLPEEELANLASILISKNEITEDDSPEAANAKQMVDAAKKEMAKFIREGGDPDDFMQYVFREQSKAFETRCMTQDMYDELAEEDPAMARDFALKANEKLADQGILPIHVEDLPDDAPAPEAQGADSAAPSAKHEAEGTEDAPSTEHQAPSTLDNESTETTEENKSNEEDPE